MAPALIRQGGFFVRADAVRLSRSPCSWAIYRPSLMGTYWSMISVNVSLNR